ncbi:MAG: tRNA (adenosine(37)-N6)-threonylcarbamoyltransferase complex dimerization subunit type 1 TsaB [Tannerella sp.]|nr:tRNA (adenosine(37)-N6)-threonylcarbamoyltransferase complex dimerization subunit type 1 TsaB [Tannerella sp.]
MAIINIETATTVCSVSLSEKGQVVFEKTSFDGPSHASLLGPFVEEAVKESKLLNMKVDAVAVSSGPGSYTGLRIGVSMAKGLCFGWNVPLISIPTLNILASKVIKLVSGEISKALFCAMLDARRMEVYAAVYDHSLQKVRDTEAEVVTEDSYSSFLEKQNVYFFGSGAGKCKSVILSPNAVFIDDLYPLAGDMALLSELAYNGNRFEDVAYFEPFYLKDFIATVSKNKVFSEK